MRFLSVISFLLYGFMWVPVTQANRLPSGMTPELNKMITEINREAKQVWREFAGDLNHSERTAEYRDAAGVLVGSLKLIRVRMFAEFDNKDEFSVLWKAYGLSESYKKLGAILDYGDLATSPDSAVMKQAALLKDLNEFEFHQKDPTTGSEDLFALEKRLLEVESLSMFGDFIGGGDFANDRVKRARQVYDLLRFTQLAFLAPQSRLKSAQLLGFWIVQNSKHPYLAILFEGNWSEVEAWLQGNRLSEFYGDGLPIERLDLQKLTRDESL